eukprot:10519006-Heterocapsa_arctica.AAC.1
MGIHIHMAAGNSAPMVDIVEDPGSSAQANQKPKAGKAKKEPARSDVATAKASSSATSAKN